VNAAYIDGFAGGTLGIAIHALRPLLEAKEQAQAVKAGSPSN
jgi:hypothetical protein